MLARKREDRQIPHPALAKRFEQWLAKKKLGLNDVLFPISGRVVGGTERKTEKMMKRDLAAARKKWIEEVEDDEEERKEREKSDFLAYRDSAGRFADFHANRHLFITSLERAGVSPKMAQTLARHSDIRLTLGVYTHIGMSDQREAGGAAGSGVALTGCPLAHAISSHKMHMSLRRHLAATVNGRAVPPFSCATHIGTNDQREVLAGAAGSFPVNLPHTPVVKTTVANRKALAPAKSGANGHQIRLPR